MADGVDQTPSDLNTTDTSAPTSPDQFDQITSNVSTLAGSAADFVQALNSPKPNNIPSNVPSTAPTAPPSKTSIFAGWSTTKKIVVGVLGAFLLFLGFKGLSAMLKA